MAFTPGTRLGPFEILGTLNVPGLGETYRVRDHEQRREVAMRVLKADFGANPDRLRRFQQEARAGALLSHANILTVHDVGTDAEAAYIISEPIDGTTLRQTLSGGAIPVRKVIQYGLQIAQGLAAAHQKGLVHRDLRPENILVGTDGRVRIAGFGLASIASSATDADPRFDMHRYGAMLYEMLTGTASFTGAPKLSSELPPALTRLVDLCLSGNTMARPTASDAAQILNQLANPPAAAPAPAVAASPEPVPEPTREPAPAPARVAPVPPAAPVPPRAASTLFPEPVLAPPPAPGQAPDVHVPEPAAPRSRLVPIVVTVAVAGLLIVIATPIGRALFGGGDAPPEPADRPPVAALVMPDRPINEFALAPDGERIAFTAVDANGQRALWVRTLATGDERALEGTEGASSPFWSDDNASIAYFANGTLRRIAAAGGESSVITEAAGTSPGAWLGDRILFARDAAGPLYQVPAGGGPASAVTSLRAGDASHGWPAFLPGGEHFLYSVQRSEGNPAVYSGAFDGSESREVLSDASRVVVADGYVVYVRDNTLAVQPFDLEMLIPRGDPIQVNEGSSQTGTGTIQAFSLSADGLLAYQVGAAAQPGQSQLVWMDRSGAQQGVVGPPGDYGDVTLSPNGTQVAVSIRSAADAGGDIAIVDVERGTATLVAADASADESTPVWSPDNKRILFASTRGGTRDIYQKSADGSGNEVAIVDGEGDQIAYDWTSDGRYLLYQTNGPGAEGRNFDLWARMLPGGPSFAYFRSIREATLPKMSPGREWVAFTSFENGRQDVFIARFPRPDGRRRVSTRGGAWPRWSREGDELFYVTPEGQLMAVAIAESVGDATPLFQLRAKPDRGYSYDVAADGERFLVSAPAEAGVAAPVSLIDWRAGLQR